jgi:Tol biopolymer transport system component
MLKRTIRCASFASGGRYRQAGMMHVAIQLFGLQSGLWLAASAMGKDVMLMNRIGPSKSALYVAASNGNGERKLLPADGFDYHASYSYDGKWIVFTSERSGYGQADVYRVHVDGTGAERLTNDPALDDQGVLSPDDSQLAFVSTRTTHRANIWILDLKTKRFRNLTGLPEIQGDPMKPDGFYRPAWSPDGKWIAFTSDRNTEWKGHDNGAGWEHLQELSVYIVHPDGTGLRRITGPGLASGSPKWSADGKQLVFYQMPAEGSWLARVDQLSALATSQIVSIDLATDKQTEQTSGPGVKLEPQFLPDGRIGYVTKSGQTSGIAYTRGTGTFPANLRSPSWSPDGQQVVYEKIDNTPRPQNQLLYSWDPNYEFRYTDVFPSFSKDGTLLVTNKDVDSSVVTMNADGSNKHLVFKSSTGCSVSPNGPCGAMDGVAFAPSWSPDGQWIVFGFGGYLRLRMTAIAKILMTRRDGTDLKELTSGTPNAGFPGFSPDGKEIVYRSWGPNEDGLRIMNLETRAVRVLTTAFDNLPGWSSASNRIVFTRKQQDGNFDIFTIKADGTDLQRLTTYPASDAHAVWSWDGKHIMWNDSEYGFKDEAAPYDNSFQPYGSIWIMNADGTGKRPLTDSHWEDAMPCIVPPQTKR